MAASNDPPRRDHRGAALKRLRTTLMLDARVLKSLRKAADGGGAEALTAYGWALGAAPEEVVEAGPMTAADVLARAAELTEDPAVSFASGLANAGGFGRRRGLPAVSRRGFAQAVRHDSSNLVPRLAVAAGKLSVGDRAGAAAALAEAADAGEYALYRSPVHAELSAESPWLAESLHYFWPDRVTEMVLYAIGAAAHRAGSARAGGDPLTWLAGIDGVARRMVALAPPRPVEFLLAQAALMRVLQARATLHGEADAAALREQLGGIVAELQEARRGLRRQLEAMVRRMTGAGVGGVGAGLATTVVGVIRSRRRWPPPFPLAVPGRQIAWLGLAVAGAAAAGITVPNPALAAWRRRVEADLARQEAGLVAEAQARVREALVALPELVAPA